MILMKKIIISLSILLVSLAVSAQEKDSVLRSKKGIPILPQKGDWSIGVDALPYLNYLGNMMNNTSDNTLDLGSYVLYGRYFLSDNTAIRVALGVDNSNDISREYVTDDAAVYKDPNAQTQDSYKEVSSHVSIDLGYQIFRGYGRLRGFYGAHIGYGYNRYKEYYTYGNPISEMNQTPTINYGSYNSNHARLLEYDGGIYQTISIGAIAGVEYYFAPKICIGGEITFSVSNSWRSQSNSKSERWGGSSVVEEDQTNSPKGRTSTSVFTKRPYGGGLYIAFHF
jgi:hypothetical protein